MKHDRLGPDAIRALDLAVQAARERHNIFVDVEHLLIGSLQADSVQRAMSANALNATALRQSIENGLSMLRDAPLDINEMNGLTKDAQQALARAADISETLASKHMTAGSLTLSVLSEPTPFVAGVLSDFPDIELKALADSIQTHTTTPTRSFDDKWKPANWENGRVLALESVPASSIQPIQLRAAQQEIARRQSGNNDNNDFISNNAPAIVAIGVLAAVLYGAVIAPEITIAVVIIAGGWMVSLVLHEFAHALVAYWGGDTGVADRGYLTLNPLKYTHPLLSIALPLFFLALGGIGLPGGAVYIDRSRLRNKYWGSAVSAAGPFASFLCLIVFSAPFWTGYVTLDGIYFDSRTQWGSLAFLCFLQATAILLNLIPIPPLDGFGIIEPFLPEDLAMQMRSFGSIGLLLIIMMFWLPSSNDFFNPAAELFNSAEEITYMFGVEQGMPGDGYRAFRFWD